MLINFHLTLFEAESLKQKTPLRMKNDSLLGDLFQAESPASGTPRNTCSDTERGVSETEDSAKKGRLR